MKYQLSELTLENFKGFKGTYQLKFNKGLTIIHGPVGSGKSSIVQAIQYALYGTQLEIKERIARLVDLVNDESSTSKIILKLQGNNSITICRCLRRTTTETARETSELYIDGNVFKKDVDSRIIELLNLDEEDFSRFVLVTHRTLEGLVYGTSSKRNIVIDKLFGIEVLENIYKTIPVRSIEEILNREREKLVKMKEIPQIIAKYGSIDKARQALNELKSRVELLKRQEDELSRTYTELLKRRVEFLEKIRGQEEVYRNYIEIKLKIEDLEKELQEKVEEVSETTLKIELEMLRQALISKLDENLLTTESDELNNLVITTDNLDQAILKIYECFKKLEELIPRLEEERENLMKTEEELKINYERLRTIKKELERRIEELEPSVKEYRELVSKYGFEDEIKKKIELLKEELERKHLNELLIDNIIQILHYVCERKLDKCPICGKDIQVQELDNLQSRLRELRKSKDKTKEVDEIKGEIYELEKVLAKMESIKGIVNEHEVLIDRLQEVKRELEIVVTKLDQIEKSKKSLEKRIFTLRRFIDEFRDKIDIIDNKLQLLRKMKLLNELKDRESELTNQIRSLGIEPHDIEILEKSLFELAKKLENIRSRINQDLTELTHLELTLEKISVEGIDIDELRRRVEKLEQLYNALVKIRNVFRKIQFEVREQIISKVKSSLNSFFKQLYPYSDLKGCSISIVSKERFGVTISEYNLYAERDGRKVPISRLSDGQRLTLALSFLLSVYETANHNLDFLIMDEPIPYVDIEVRRAFAKLLIKLLSDGMVSQLIITTQSKELTQELISEAKNIKIPITLIELSKDIEKISIKVL